MRKSVRSSFSFDSRSVVLLAAMSLGSMGAFAQTSANTTVRKPQVTQSQSAPPMTASPAFGPVTGADKGTGAATDPDKRPEINATRPTPVKPATAPTAVKKPGASGAAPTK